MRQKKLLILGHTFPEPSTTAAGTRMQQLIQLFLEEMYEIVFASAASVSEKTMNFGALGIVVRSISLNDPSFDTFISNVQPDVVLFDRYITEEQYGWRVAEHCPNALRILDTEDLHFLRKARALAVKSNKSFQEANVYTELAKRELASILRCDLSLIISEYEMTLLTETFNIPKNILYYLPILVDCSIEIDKGKQRSFHERNHFITLGNFLHAPNVDAVLWLQKEIWPLIIEQLPAAEMHVYGGYVPQKIQQLHNPKIGFHIKGWAPSVQVVMSRAKVCLAPLRFGAGLKGKLIDAMKYGTPSVTTSVGAEGLAGDLPFNGMVADTTESIVNESVKLYTQQSVWEKAQDNGYVLVRERFDQVRFSEVFKNRVRKLANELIRHREEQFIGQVIQHHTLQATRYLSKWIEAKNK